ncbi:hypothetical protein [Shumkonia mesophila]|uniref:hypothetical protein n=1 Tax=Shumkonia mesophila TaxID=2838854 RepID=UPI0029352F83|nr:hypothetical protein [Shumkonia mesophila]
MQKRPSGENREGLFAVRAMLKDARKGGLELDLERTIHGNQDDRLDQGADQLAGFGAGVFAAERALRRISTTWRFIRQFREIEMEPSSRCPQAVTQLR